MPPLGMAASLGLGAPRAATSSGSLSGAKTDEQKIEDGDVGGGVPWLWLDAASGVTAADGSLADGDAISAWASRSGSRSAAQSTASYQPTWVESAVNSLPAVYFYGDVMQMASEQWDAANVSFFYLGKYEYSQTGSQPFGRWAYSDSARQFIWLQQSYHQKYGGALYVPSTNIADYLLDETITDGANVTMRRGTSGSAIADFATSTIFDATGIQDKTAVSGVGGAYRTVDGSAVYQTSYLKMCEMLIWEGTLSDDDRDIVETYLATKYGIAQ